MPLPPRSRRLARLTLLLGSLVVGLSVLSYWQVARMTPQYAELVVRLERAERSPGQPHAALDHARASLMHLQARDAARWQLGGYALSHTVGLVLGVALLALGLRLRSQ